MPHLHADLATRVTATFAIFYTSSELWLWHLNGMPKKNNKNFCLHLNEISNFTKKLRACSGIERKRQDARAHCCKNPHGSWCTRVISGNKLCIGCRKINRMCEKKREKWVICVQETSLQKGVWLGSITKIFVIETPSVQNPTVHLMQHWIKTPAKKWCGSSNTLSKLGVLLRY